MEKIKLSVTLPVEAKTLFKAWLNSKSHSAFTGGVAKVNSKIGGNYTAWDGYISGKNLELRENQFIKQSWRTSEFAVVAEDSILELSFKEKNVKTTLELYHYHLQPGDGKKYLDGWKEFYFEPMRSYFNKVS
jgi:activator of HSP90 ATPase